jgi:hypothetical protein
MTTPEIRRPFPERRRWEDELSINAETIADRTGSKQVGIGAIP